MIRLYKNCLRALQFAIALAISVNANAQNTYTSTTGGNFRSAIWDSPVPDFDNIASDTFIIASGHVVTLESNITIRELQVVGTFTIGNDATGRSLTINESLIVQSLGNFDVASNDANHSVSVGGDIVHAGATFDLVAGTDTANLTLTNTGTSVISGNTLTLNDFTINGGGALILTASLDVNGDFSADGSGVDISTSVNHNFGGDFTLLNSATFTATSSTQFFDGTSAQAIGLSGGAATFNNLTFDNSTKTVTGNLVSDGTFEITADAVWSNPSGGTNQLAVFEVKNASGISLTNGSVTFTGGEIRFGDGTATDGNITLGSGTNITFDGPCAIERDDSLTVAGDVEITSDGYLVINGVDNAPAAGTGDSELLVTGSRTLTIRDQGDLFVRGYDNFPTGFTTYTLENLSLVRYDGNFDQLIMSENSADATITFGRLYLSQGDAVSPRWTKTLDTGDDDLHVAGQFDLVNGVGFEVSHTATMTLNEDLFVDSGTGSGDPLFDANSATVIFDSDNNQTIDGPVSGDYIIDSLVITNSATPTTVRRVNIDDNISITGGITIQNPNGTEANNLIVDLDDNQFSGTAGDDYFTLNDNCAIYTSTNSANGFALNFNGAGDVISISNSSIVRFDRGGDQTIPAFNGGVFGNIQFAGSGNKFVISSLDINGDVTRVSGTPVFRFGTNPFPATIQVDHTVSGDWNLGTAYTGDDESNGGVADQSITFDGADQILSGSDFVDVIFGGTGTKTLTGTLFIDDDLTVNDAVTVAAGSEAIDIAGDWTENGTAVFTQTGSTTDFLSGGTQNVTVTSNSIFNDFDITNSTTVNLLSNVQVGRDVDIQNGSTLNIEGQTIRIGRDITVNSTGTLSYTTPGTSIIIFDGDVEQDIRTVNAATTYPTLQFEGVGNKELLNNAVTIEGDITISSESTFNGNSLQINFEGDTWTNNGNFNHNNSVNFVNSGGSTSVGTSTFHDIDIGSSDGSITTTVNLTGNITLNGELNIFANTTLDVSASNYSITVEEDWNNYGVFNEQQGTVTFTGGQTDFRTFSGVANSGTQADKAFYNLTINLNSGSNFLISRGTAVLNDQIDITNNLNVESGNFRLYENANASDAFIGGDFVITGGAIVFDHTDGKITMNGTSGTHSIDLGGDLVRDFEIDAAGATYQLTNNFEIRDNAGDAFILTNGTLDLNGNILTVNRGGFDFDGGTLEVDEGATLILDGQAADPDFDMTGGTFQLVGVDGNPSTLTSLDDNGFTFTQTGGDFQARYYTISGPTSDGIRIESGAGIDITSTGNNFSDGTFTSGFGTAYLTLDTTALNNISASSVIFNAGATNNVSILDAGAGYTNQETIEFVIAGGTLAGAQDEDDLPDGGATTGFIRWDEDPGFIWLGTTDSNWDDATNWDDSNVTDGDGIPDGDDIVYIPAGSVGAMADPQIVASDSFGVARMTIRSGGSLTFTGDGELSVAGNVTIFSGCTLDMSASSTSRLNVAGAWSNAGTLAEGTATITFNGTSGTHSITTGGTSDDFYNLTIDGDGATYTMGSIIEVTNAFTLSNGTFDASAGFDFYINNTWLVNGGIFEPGQGRVRFNGSTGTQSISGGTMWDILFEGNGAKSIDGNIQAGDDIRFNSSGLVAGNSNTIFVGGDWDVDVAGGFTPGTGTVIFNGEATQNIENDNNQDISFNNVIFQNAGVKNFFRATTVSGDFSVISENSFVDLESGVTVTVTGTLSQTGGTIRVFDSNFPTAGTYSLTGGEVEFRNDGAQTIPGNITFNDVEIRDNGGGTTTASTSGSITINDDLVLGNGAVTLSVGNDTITLADVFSLGNTDVTSWGANGTIIHTGGFWNIDADFNTSNRTFQNLILNGTSIKRFNSDVDVNGNLTVGTGVELEQLTRVITNDGGDAFTMEAGSILDTRVTGVAFPTGFSSYSLDATSTVQLQGTGAQTLFTNSGTLEYGDLDVFRTGNVTLDGNLTVQGDFDMNGNPTLLDGGFNLTLNGSTNDIQDYTPTASTTVTFSRSGDQLIQDNDGAGQDLRFDNVVFGGSGTKTLTPNAVDEVTDVDGNVTINSGVTVTTARGLDFSGSTFTNNGTFNLTVTTRPFVFSGAVQSMDPGTNDIAAMTVSNSDTVTITNNGLDLGNGDLVISAGATIDFGSLSHNLASENVTIDAAGGWILQNGGTGASLDFDQNGGQNIPIIDQGNANVDGIPSVTFSTAGVKLLTGAIVVDDLTIGANVDLDVDNTNNYQVTVNGSWDNNGGDFFERDGTVIFNSDDTNAKTIDPNGERFRALTFQGTAIRTYTLQGDALVEGNAAGVGMTLASATLDLNGNTLTLGDNDSGDPDAEANTIGNNGTLQVDAGATLQFDTFDDGGDVADTEIGGDLDVESGGRLTVVGASGSLATITRSAGGNRIDINIESGGEIEAEFYTMQYLTDEGLEVEDGATVDPGANGFDFSNGTFSNLETDAGDGTGGDDNPVSGNRYLTIESDAALTIDNVTFNFDGTPTIGNHYNVTRSNAGGNNTIDWNNTSGPLGRSGSIYEDDGDPTLPAESNGQLTWDLPTDTQWLGGTSTDWSTASNWDNGLPSLSNEAIINLGQPFNPTLNSGSINIAALIINDGILKILGTTDFDLDGDLILGDGTGGALIMDNTATLEVEGSWTASANAIFDNGDGTVSFDAASGSTVSISAGDQSFYNLTFTNATTAGEFIISGGTLDVNGNLIIENSGNVIPAATGYTYNIAGNITATGGSFDTSVDGEITLDGAAQTLTDMSFDELVVSGSGIKATAGTTVVNDVMLIESGVTLQGGGGITFNGDVTIEGTFDGVNGQTYTMTADDWIAAPNSYTGQGTVEFNATAGTQYIRQSTAGNNPVEFHNLTFSGGARIELGRLVGGTQYDGNIDMTGDLTINNTINILDVNDYTIDNVPNTGTLTLAANEFIQVTGANNFPTGFAIYSMDDNSTVRYWGTIDQTVAGGIEYGNLDLNNSTTKTLGGNIDVDGDILFRNSTLDVSTSNYSINIADRWDTNNGNDDGSFIARSGTVTFDGAASQTLDIGETGTQDFNDVVVNKSGGNVEVATSNININGNINVFNGTFDANGFTATIGGNMTASGTGSYTSGAGGLYYLNATTGTPTIAANGSSIPGSMEIDASGRTYELVDDLTLLSNFTLTAGTLDINGQTMSIGDFEDAVNIFGTLNVSTTSKPGGTLALGNDVQLVVNPGGSISIVGTSSQPATITSTGTTDYIFSVTGTGGNPGTIAARYYLIEYVNVDGIYVNANTTIDATNNFSNGTFQNGFAGGKYLRIENTQDLTGSNRIEDIVFDDNPGGGASNVYKATAATGDIEIFNYSGGFSGEDYDEDPNNLITWLDPPTVTWTGTSSTDWFTGANWDSGTVPNSSQDVIIPQTLNEPIITDNTDTAFANNVTIEVNAVLKVNTADAADADLIIGGDITFEASGRFESLGTEDAIEIGGSWVRLSTALFTPGTSQVTFDSQDGIELIDNSDSFYDLIIDVTGTATLSTDLTVDNDFTINGGSFDMSSFDMTVAENFANSGTINAQSQTISLIPGSTSSPKTFDPGASELYSLVVGESAGNDVTYQLSNDLTVNHDLDLVIGTIEPNGNNLSFGNSDATADNINIAGDITVGANESMSLGDDATVLIQNGGNIKFIGSDISNVATLTRRTTGAYDFTVQSGASLEGKFFLMEYMDGEGIWLQSGSTLVALDSGTFQNGSDASYYMRSSNSFGASNITASRIQFNSGPTNNVRRNEAAGDTLIFSDALGALAGATFELDDGNADDGELRWEFTNPLTVWTGGSSNTNWADAGNWTNGVPGNTNTVQIPGALGFYPVINSTSGAGDAASITIFSGATLDINDNLSLTVVNELTNEGTITITGTGSISVGDTWTNNGTFNPGNSTVSLTSDADVTLSGGATFYNLTLNGSASSVVFSSSAALDVDNDFTVTQGIYNVTNSSHTTNIGGNLTVDDVNGTFVDNLSTLTLDGAAQNIGSASETTTITLNNLTLAGSNTKTVEDSLIVNGDISIGTGTTLALNDQYVSFAGSNFDVDGSFTGGGAGTLEFNGSQIQVITGNVTEVDFDSLIVSNTSIGNSDIQLNIDVNINDNVDFVTGVIQSSGSNPLTFNDGSSVSFDGTIESPVTFPGADSDGNSYVVGPVSKIGAGDFIFPTGEGSKIARIAISSISGGAATDEFSAQYFNSRTGTADSAKTGNLVRVSDLEFWDLDRLNGAGQPMVTLYWDASSEVDNISTLLVGHFDGTSWEDLGRNGGQTSGNASGGYITSSTAATSFSPITLGTSYDGDNPLPVELVSFDAEVAGNAVELSWSTATEENNDYFEVQSSSDGVNFTALGEVVGAGNSNVLNNYAFVDGSPKTGINYYRLKQVDFDGGFQYSELVAISFNPEATGLQAQLFPNPTSERSVNLQLSTDDLINEINVKVIDNMGRVLLLNTYSPESFVTKGRLVLDDAVTNGMYYVIIAQGSNKIQRRLIITE